MLTGLPIGYSGRNSVGGLNPLTNGYGESEAGGFFGAELKFAGFDAVVIQGQAEKPVYLWIHDGEVEIRDAAGIWGLKTADAQERVRAATGWHTNMFELTKVGERSVTLARAVNVRRGMTSADDRIPERFFEPIEASPQGVPLDREAFADSLTLYYGMMGWDEETGIPTRAKLEELGVGWALPIMREGVK